MITHNDLAFTTQVSTGICCVTADQVQPKSVTLNPIMDPLNVSSTVSMPRNAYIGLLLKVSKWTLCNYKPVTPVLTYI